MLAPGQGHTVLPPAALAASTTQTAERSLQNHRAIAFPQRLVLLDRATFFKCQWSRYLSSLLQVPNVLICSQFWLMCRIGSFLETRFVRLVCLCLVLSHFQDGLHQTRLPLSRAYLGAGVSNLKRKITQFGDVAATGHQKSCVTLQRVQENILRSNKFKNNLQGYCIRNAMRHFFHVFQQLAVEHR